MSGTEIYGPVVGRTRKPLKRTVFVCLFLMVALVGCITEPFTGRRTLQLIPEGQLNQMGVDAYQQILTDAKISTDAANTAMLRRVGERIAAVVDPMMAEDGRPPFEWEFTLIDDPNTVNAFALPAGKIAFYSGILPVCGDETGVAVVMGHEVAHAYAGHGNNRMSTQVVTQYGLAAAAAALSGDGDSEITQLSLAALGVGSQLGSLAFGRHDESAADEIGLVVMARAGYDPRQAAAFWKRMSELSGGQAPPEFLSTHPSHPTRIRDIEEKLPEALKEYEKSSK